MLALLPPAALKPATKFFFSEKVVVCFFYVGFRAGIEMTTSSM
jgi:hypothetical protein